MGRKLRLPYFEAQHLSSQLVEWLGEPRLYANNSSATRIKYLRRWLQDIKSTEASHVGAKHPLLPLVADELVDAWGSETRFVWSWRSIETSIVRLKKRKWWPGCEARMQQRIWRSINEFLVGRSHRKIRFENLKTKPRQEIDQLIDFLGLTPTPKQISRAVRFINKDRDQLKEIRPDQ